MNKKELTETAEALGLNVPKDATAAQIQAMIEEANSPGDPKLTRRKVNRGSTRRITNAMGKFDAAMGDFIKEMDLQFFEADADGNRTGEWDFVKALREMRTGVMAEVNKQLYPEAEASGDE
mgnify:CR=1 FL=1